MEKKVNPKKPLQVQADPSFLVCKGEVTKEEKEHLLQIGHIYENEDGEILDVSTLTESGFAEDLDLSSASVHEVPAEQPNFQRQPLENKENSFDASSLELNMPFPPTPVTNNLGPRRSNRVTKKPFADLNNSSVCASPYKLQRLYEETNKDHKESEQEKVVVDESITVAEHRQNAADELLFISSPDVTMHSTFDKEANKRDLEGTTEDTDKLNDRPVENENTFNASAFEPNTFFPPTPVTANKILQRSLRLAKKPFPGSNTSIVSASPMGLQRLFEEPGNKEKEISQAEILAILDSGVEPGEMYLDDTFDAVNNITVFCNEAAAAGHSPDASVFYPDLEKVTDDTPKGNENTEQEKVVVDKDDVVESAVSEEINEAPPQEPENNRRGLQTLAALSTIVAFGSLVATLSLRK